MAATTAVFYSMPMATAPLPHLPLSPQVQAVMPMFPPRTACWEAPRPAALGQSYVFQNGFSAKVPWPKPFSLGASYSSALLPRAPPPEQAPPRAPAPPPPLPPDEALDAKILAELAKKCKTLDHTTAEIIDPADFEAGLVHELDTELEINIVPNFLTDREIAHLLSLAEGFYGPSLVMTAGAQGRLKDMKTRGSELRTSWSTLIDYAQTPIVQEIERRLCELADINVDYLERLAMVRYEPGQQYKVHHDGLWRPITVFIYLNDLPDDDEGETYFPNLGIKILPRRGTAVMWPNTAGKKEHEDLLAMHAGLPTKTGRKYGVNCFFNYEPKRLMKDKFGEFRGQGPPESITTPRCLKGSHKVPLSAQSRSQSLSAPILSRPKVPVRQPSSRLFRCAC